jgi:hypothetical protein
MNRARWLSFALKGLLEGDFGSPFTGPGLGESAPDFTLPSRDGKERVCLTQHRGGKSAVLVFGSFSCGVTRARFAALEDLYAQHGDQVAFLAVYVREAHPADGRRTRYNQEAGIAIPQPREQGERQAVAQQCCSTLGITMPLVVDTMDDYVGLAYSGLPNQLYLLDRNGRVAYKSGRGPYGLLPGEMEQALLLLQWGETPRPAEYASNT